MACVNAKGRSTLVEVGLVETVIDPGSTCHAALTFVIGSPEWHALIAELLGLQVNSSGKRFTVHLSEMRG